MEYQNRIFNMDCIAGMSLLSDACMGSGTTKVACRNSGRNYTGFEIDPRSFETAQNR